MSITCQAAYCFDDLLSLFVVISDWLLDRRHCDVKWQTAVLEIREKINAAIQDMPPVDEISQLLSGTCESISITVECCGYCVFDYVTLYTYIYIHIHYFVV